MAESDALYAQLKPDLQTIAAPLMDFGEQQVRKNGGFLPFGATLNRDREVALQAALPESDPATSADVLPLLVQALDAAAREDAVIAVALAEWVKIAEPGGPFQDAIKVHVHHRRGLSIAFHVPAAKRLLRGWTFGEPTARPADTLVKSW